MCLAHVVAHACTHRTKSSDQDASVDFNYNDNFDPPEGERWDACLHNCKLFGLN